jgi:hypothetical protein
MKGNGKGMEVGRERAFTSFVKRNRQGLMGKRRMGEDGKGQGEWKGI